MASPVVSSAWLTIILLLLLCSWQLQRNALRTSGLYPAVEPVEAAPAQEMARRSSGLRHGRSLRRRPQLPPLLGRSLCVSKPSSSHLPSLFPQFSLFANIFLFGFASQKPLGGGSSGGPGPAPKQRPSPSPAPSTTPPQPPPPKISKSPSFIQEEIEVAEVLFGLTRQFPCLPPKQESNHKLEPRDAPEAKSGNSSPAPSSSGARPADSTSLSTIGA